MQLTPFIKQIMDEYLHKKVVNLDYDTKLNILLYKLSQIVGCFRIKYYGNIINYYGICFAPSGHGKDYTEKSINNYLFRGFTAKYSDLKEKNISIARTNLEEEAFNLYKPDRSGNTDKNEKKRNDWLFENEKLIREIALEVSLSKNSSSQGLTAEASALAKYPFGSLNILVSELSFYIKSMKAEDHAVLQHLSDLYEGEIKPYVLKHEAKKVQIKDVVCNSLMFCDPCILLDSKEKAKFLSQMQTSFARRSFLTHQSRNILQWVDFSDVHQYDEYCLQNLTPRINQIVAILEDSNRQITFSDSCIRVYNEYGLKNTNYYNRISKFTPDVALNEVLDRPYRARKLACIIACIEHPENLEVQEEDMVSAISITEQFGKYLEQFIEAAPQDEGDKLYFYLLKNKHRWITKTDIREKKFVYKDNFKAWFDEEIKSLRNKAIQDGYYLIEQKHNKNTGVKYMLVEQGQENLIELQEKITKMDEIIYSPRNTEITFSYSNDMTKGYIAYNGNFAGMEAAIKAPNIHYSASRFKDGYRKSDNFIGEPNLIILDFDDGLTLSEARDIFKPFINCISTSRNHQKEKNGKVNDRFRVILPTYTIPEDQYV